MKQTRVPGQKQQSEEPPAVGANPLSIVTAKVPDTFRFSDGMGQMVKGHRPTVETRRQTSGVDLEEGKILFS